MKEKWIKKNTWLPVFIVAAILWLLELLFFTQVGEKWLTFGFGVAAVALLLWRSGKPMWNVSSLLFLGYIVFAGFGAFWAMSGKFFLREYSKIIVMLPIFLYVLLKPQVDRAFVRRVMRVLALVSAVVAFLSIETISTGLFRFVIHHSEGLSSLQIGFAGHRLYGIYGNSNVEASIFAIGILASLACLAEAGNRKDRIISTVLCTINAYAFLFCISIGAMLCFALAVVVYLIAAGQSRVQVLLRMLIVAIPTVLFASLGFVFAEKGGRYTPLILVMLVLNAAVSSLLEIFVMDKLTARLEKYTKLPIIILLVLIVAGVIYAVAAVNMTSAYTFTSGDTVEEPLSRADYTDPGAHTLEVQATGDVTVQVYYQTKYDVLQGQRSYLYEGSAVDPISFTVPEDSIVCFYTFWGEPGTTITSAVIDSATDLPLKYTILPGFIADRIQGAWSSSSLLFRQELWIYGLRLFRMSPVIGLGCGAFESGLARVEDIVYETKYVHNHYIQVMLESGAIGFAFYVSALLSLIVLVVKKRRLACDPEFGWVYPVLAAVLAMVCTVTFWDLPMSRAIYLAMVYAVFALIIRLMATSLPVKQVDVSALSKREKALLDVRKQNHALTIRICSVILPTAFLISLVGNIYAHGLISKPASSYEEYYSNLRLSAEMDPYEYNDAKLTYVLTVGEQGDEMYLDQANQYAEDLMQVSSNSIPCRLQAYYINVGQYEKAMEAAQRAAVCSAADPKIWNTTFRQLWTGIILNEDALAKHVDTVLPMLLTYFDTFNERNANAIEPIELEEPASSAYRFLGELKRLDQIDRQQAVDYLNEILAEANGTANG